jgi:hypothetical protein
MTDTKDSGEPLEALKRHASPVVDPDPYDLARERQEDRDRADEALEERNR